MFAAFRALQFLPDSWQLEDNARNGGRHFKFHLEYRGIIIVGKLGHYQLSGSAAVQNLAWACGLVQ